MTTEYLTLKWSVSRGAETWGYNLCTLTRGNRLRRNNNKWQTGGGGYDMLGACLGNYLNEAHQGRLMGLVDRAAAEWVKGIGGSYKTFHNSGLRDAIVRPGCLYGLGVEYNRQGVALRAAVDGACGLRCVEDIARAAGLRIIKDVNGRGQLRGFIVSYDEPLTTQ